MRSARLFPAEGAGRGEFAARREKERRRQSETRDVYLLRIWIAHVAERRRPLTDILRVEVQNGIPRGYLSLTHSLLRFTFTTASSLYLMHHIYMYIAIQDEIPTAISLCLAKSLAILCLQFKKKK